MATAISISNPKIWDKGMPPARPAWWTTWRRLARNIPAMIGLVIILMLLFTGIVGPFLMQYSYSTTDLSNVRAAPSAKHLLGTDDLGRDMLTRLVYGARSVIFVITVVTLLNLAIGLPLGAAAGYFGGWVDTIISRICDFLFAFPGLLFILFFVATVKPGMISWIKGLGLNDFVKSGYADYLVVIVALGILGWAGLARLIRGQIFSLREKEFVMSGRAIGLPSWKIILKYLIPNALSPIIVALSMGMGGIALTEGVLAYLGIGLQPPNPSWGSIIADNAALHWRDWPSMLWLVLAPGLILAAVVFAFNFLGDGLNEALNPEIY